MSNMFGIDVYHGDIENGFDINKVKADFLICKSSQGTGYTDPKMNSALKAASKAGKLIGIYHFADGKSSGKAEADHFLDVIDSWIGKALLVLDWEANAVTKGTGYAKAFSDRVYDKTGIKTIIYMSTSTIGAYNWSEYAKKYPYIWGARYGSNKTIFGYSNDIYKEGMDVSPFKKEIIRQYSEKTHLNGYNGELDVNKCYITKEEWKKLQNPKGASSTDSESSSSKKPSEKPKSPKMTVDQVAKKIINGEDGWAVNGDARRKKLINEGYDADAVQKRINELVNNKKPKMSVDQVAKKIINGKGEWAVTGEARRKKLKAEGYDPDAVQKRINQLLR